MASGTSRSERCISTRRIRALFPRPGHNGRPLLNGVEGPGIGAADAVDGLGGKPSRFPQCEKGLMLLGVIVVAVVRAGDEIAVSRRAKHVLQVIADPATDVQAVVAHDVPAVLDLRDPRFFLCGADDLL